MVVTVMQVPQEQMVPMDRQVLMGRMRTTSVRNAEHCKSIQTVAAAVTTAVEALKHQVVVVVTATAQTTRPRLNPVLKTAIPVKTVVALGVA